jgi:hypothetical protein
VRFGYVATQAAVQSMIRELEQSLIKDRAPEVRARAIIAQFVKQPDVKKVLDDLVEHTLMFEPKQARVVENLLENVKAAIAVHKHLRNPDSKMLMQVSSLPCVPRAAFFVCASTPYNSSRFVGVTRRYRSSSWLWIDPNGGCHVRSEESPRAARCPDAYRLAASGEGGFRS